MRAIDRRLLKLEKLLAPTVEIETDWGEMAHARAELLRLAEERGAPPVDQLSKELDAAGPAGLWFEAVRTYLRDHGFIQSERESFAETIARALDITGHELRNWMTQGRVGPALLERFREPGIATDNTNYRSTLVV